MTCKERLEAYLREHHVPYQVQQHSLAYTAQGVAASEHVPGKMMAKVVMVVAGGAPVMVTLPAPDRVDLAKVAEALGVKEVRLAREEEFAHTFPDCEVGAMPPFGNLYDIPVWVDRALTDDETIVFNAGTHTETMSVAYPDFERLVHPHVAEVALQA